jgi:hypothetical protein
MSETNHTCECGNSLETDEHQCEWCVGDDAARLIGDTHKWVDSRFDRHCAACGNVWFRTVQDCVDIAMSGPCTA